MKKEMILIADDQRISRYSLKEILSPKYFVVEASNTKQAINFMKNNSDVLDLVFCTEAMDFKEIYKTKTFLDRDVGICVSVLNNDPKIIADAKAIGINNFIMRPYNADMVLKLTSLMLENTKEERFLNSEYLNQYNQMIKENIDLEKDNFGSCRIDFERENISDVQGLVKDIFDQKNHSFTEIIIKLSEKLVKQEAKEDFLNMFSYKNIRENFKNKSYILECENLFDIDGKMFNIKAKVANISSVENGPNKALFVLLDETDEYEKNRINTELFKSYYDVVALINLKDNVCLVQENKIDGLSFGDRKIDYQEFVKELGSSLFDKDDFDDLAEKFNIENVITALGNFESFDLTSAIKRQKIIFYQFSFKYLDEFKDQLIFYVTDITTQKEHDSFTDSLSYAGFMNRTYDLIKGKKKKFAVVYGECTNYKQIVEFVGLDTVVVFLRQLFRIVKDSFLSPYLIGRSVSDSFWCLVDVEGIDLTRLEEFRTIELKEDDDLYYLNFKFGIYVLENLPSDLRSSDIDSFCEKAKVASSTIGEESSRNYAEFDTSLKNDFTIKTSIVNQLRAGEGKTEIQIMYQPIFDIRGKKVVYAEALVRWKHEEYGFISPAVFIPYLEAYGGISEVDKAVILKVNSFVRELNELSLGVPITVNLSRRDFFDNELVQMVRAISKEHFEQNEKGTIAYEVTESFGIDISNNIANILTELRSNNAKILLDDFGDGVSSLKALISSHFDVIKIYKGLVDEIGQSKISEAAIKSTVDMCHTVGIKVLAEGVEHKEQLEFLKKVGVDYIQGYIFSKPIPKEQFVELLQKL